MDPIKNKFEPRPCWSLLENAFLILPEHCCFFNLEKDVMLFYTPGFQANNKTINRYFEAMVFKREVSKKCMFQLKCKVDGKDS